MSGGGEKEASFGRWASVRSCRALLAQGDLEFYSESHAWEAFGGLHTEKPWCWEMLKAGREGDDRGRDGWMASPTQRTWVWASSGGWWRTGKPGVLQSMGLQRVGNDWATEQWQQCRKTIIFLKLALYKYLQGTRYCSKCFVCIVLNWLNPHNSMKLC